MGASTEVFAGLDALIERINTPDYESIDGFVFVKTKDAGKNSQANKLTGSAEIEASAEKQAASGKLASERENKLESGSELQYAQVLMRVVGVNELIDEMRKILNSLGLKYLYIFLDDFSELPEEAMRVLVDSLISPLTRWSDFIKFKIAAYPGRVYLGTLDKTKIEEVHLDIYGLYGTSSVSNMEEKATDFVKRVIERRMQVYCKKEAAFFFDTKSEELWRVLFYASMANPRILGHIILYAHESNILYGKR